jgi:hypothetical protein
MSAEPNACRIGAATSGDFGVDEQPDSAPITNVANMGAQCLIGVMPITGAIHVPTLTSAPLTGKQDAPKNLQTMGACLYCTHSLPKGSPRSRRLCDDFRHAMQDLRIDTAEDPQHRNDVPQRRDRFRSIRSFRKFSDDLAARARQAAKQVENTVVL